MGDGAARPRRSNGKASEHGELRGERLGRGDADFRTGIGGEDQVGFAGHGAVGDIDQGDDFLALGFRVAKCRQGIRGFAGLRNEERNAALGHLRLAVAEFRSDIDFDRQLGDFLEPVFRDQRRVRRRAASDDGQLRHRFPFEGQLRQLDGAGQGIEEGAQRIADDGRLLVDFLQHEMAEIALADRGARGGGELDVAGNLAVLDVADLGALAGQHRPIAFFEIADLLREGRQRQRIGAEIHFAVAKADGERAAVTRADHQRGLAGENEPQRERAFEALQRDAGRFFGRHAFFDVLRHQMGDHFGIGFGDELGALGFEFAPQLLEILDDAVMDHGDLVGRVRVRVALVGRAMGRPARMADADGAGNRLIDQPHFQIGKLALGAPPLDLAVDQCGDARRIVAAIFEPPQPFDEQGGDFVFADDADDAAHGLAPGLGFRFGRFGGGFLRALRRRDF